MKRTPTLSPITARAASWLAMAAVWALPALALAQQFEKVEGKASQEVPAVPFVGIAYGFIWIAVLAYVFSVARVLGRVRGELTELRRKVDAGGAGGPAAPGSSR